MRRSGSSPGAHAWVDFGRGVGGLSMMVPLLVLTGLIMLLVVLVFGFVGCLIAPDRPPAGISITVRVPGTLTVMSIRYSTDYPNGSGDLSDQMNPTGSTTPEGETEFSHFAGVSMTGTWTVRCRVIASDANGVQATKQGLGSFIVDSTDDDHTAKFQVTGSPMNNFDVTYVGLD
jgi:hypothetical protein